MPYRKITHALSIGLCLAAMSLSAWSASLPDDVLLRNRWVQITKADYDDAISKLPEKARADYPTSPKRVESLLNQILVNKTLAAQAKTHGIQGEFNDNSLAVAESTNKLAVAELQLVEKQANADFDARKADFEKRAAEIYKLESERFREPEAVRISDIAVAVKDRGDAAALARAREARARVVAGEDFALVAREMSDSTVIRDNGKERPFITPKQLDPAFARGVFALTKPGEISEPIKGKAAYHIVRLDEKRSAQTAPFSDVREKIMQEQRKKFVSDARDARMRSIFADPDLQVNQPVVDALVKRVEVPAAPAAPAAPTPAR